MTKVIRNFVAGLSSREKKMLGAMGIIAILLICFLTSYLVSRSVSELEDKITEFEELVDFVRAMEEPYFAAKEEKNSEKPEGKPRPLRTLVDQAVSKIGIREPDTKELNDKTHASGWLEKSAEVSFDSIDVSTMVRFMEEILKNKSSFPISITHIDVRQQRQQRMQTGIFRVALTINTYERKEELFDANLKKEGVR